MIDLNNVEQDHVRAAMRFLRSSVGSWELVANALKFSPKTIANILWGRNVSASLALRVSRLLDTSIDDLLSGKYQFGACAKCGHVPSYMPRRSSDFTDEQTAVEAAPRPAASMSLVP
jgi:hypothetical protein